MSDTVNLLREIVEQADRKFASWRYIYGKDTSAPLAVQIDWPLIERARTLSVSDEHRAVAAAQAAEKERDRLLTANTELTFALSQSAQARLDLQAENASLKEALERIDQLARLIAHDLQGRVEGEKVAAVLQCADIARAALALTDKQENKEEGR